MRRVQEQMKKNFINSAGLLYFHLCGKLLDEERVILETADSYRYFEKGFYENSKEMFEKTMDEEDIEKEDLITLRNAEDCTCLVLDKWEDLMSAIEDVTPI